MLHLTDSMSHPYVGGKCSNRLPLDASRTLIQCSSELTIHQGCSGDSYRRMCEAQALRVECNVEFYIDIEFEGEILIMLLCRRRLQHDQIDF